MTNLISVQDEYIATINAGIARWSHRKNGGHIHRILRGAKHKATKQLLKLGYSQEVIGVLIQGKFIPAVRTSPVLNIDVPLLKRQKRTLVTLQSKVTTTAREKEAIEGVLNLLDAVQDDAEGFELDPTHVSRIKLRKSWKHVA